jgi:hypothetical protein
MSRRFAVFIAVLAVAGLAMAGVATADNGGRPLSTTLSGSNGPSPGDPNATGEAEITLNQGQGRVCYDLSWANVEGTVTMGHIHVGSADASGPVAVPLFAGSLAGTDTMSGCVQGVEPAVIKEIRQDPAGYYVNLHSTAFPGGALRGQLGK